MKDGEVEHFENCPVRKEKYEEQVIINSFLYCYERHVPRPPPDVVYRARNRRTAPEVTKSWLHRRREKFPEKLRACCCCRCWRWWWWWWWWWWIVRNRWWNGGTFLGRVSGPGLSNTWGFRIDQMKEPDGVWRARKCVPNEGWHILTVSPPPSCPPPLPPPQRKLD